MAANPTQLTPTPPASIAAAVLAVLAEDIGSGDLTAALVPETQRRSQMYDLKDRVVEDYYTERGLDVPEYSYVMHCATTKPKDGEPARDHMHTHVILPVTAPSNAERLPVYNNSTRGHDRLFREIASRHFAEALDLRIGPAWRRLREIPAPERDVDGPIDLDAFCSR